MMPLVSTQGGFDLVLGDRLVLRHRPDAPCLFVGLGHARMHMYRGNFDVEDRLTERTPLRHAEVRSKCGAKSIVFAVNPGQPPRIMAMLRVSDDAATIEFATDDPALNRFWLRLVAEADEHVWGGGEQMSYLDLRDRRFPLWTSEPGVGRDKASTITFQADREGRAGGDYWNTQLPSADLPLLPPLRFACRDNGIHRV
jgi:alpha-glucosidase